MHAGKSNVSNDALHLLLTQNQQNKNEIFKGWDFCYHDFRIYMRHCLIFIQRWIFMVLQLGLCSLKENQANLGGSGTLHLILLVTVTKFDIRIDLEVCFFLQVVENFMNRFLIHTTKDYHSVSLPLVSVWIQVCLKRLCWECPGTLSSCNTIILTFYGNYVKIQLWENRFFLCCLTVNCTFFNNYFVLLNGCKKNTTSAVIEHWCGTSSRKFLQPFLALNIVAAYFCIVCIIWAMSKFLVAYTADVVFSLNIIS